MLKPRSLLVRLSIDCFGQCVEVTEVRGFRGVCTDFFPVQISCVEAWVAFGASCVLRDVVVPEMRMTTFLSSLADPIRLFCGCFEWR